MMTGRPPEEGRHPLCRPRARAHPPSIRPSPPGTVQGAIAESWGRKGSGGSDLSLRSDNLHSVGELYTEDDFRQLVVAIEATPTFFGSLGQLEDHGERGLV